MAVRFQLDREIFGSVVAGAAWSGIGIAFATLRVAEPGDLLAFAGGLIGAGVAVWGAFASIERAGRKEAVEARTLLRQVAAGVQRDMKWLLDLQSCQSDDDDFVRMARRIDSIAADVPQLAILIREERLGTRTGSVATVAADLRFRAALEVAAPFFARLDAERRDWRNRLSDPEDLSLPISPQVLAELKDAAAATLRDA